MHWLVRSDDVYLCEFIPGFTNEPWWGTRDEARRFVSSRAARSIARKVRAYPGTFGQVVVVRIVRRKVA